MTDSITILRATAGSGEDAQGNPNPGVDVEIPSDGWAVAPLTADEDSLATGQQAVMGFTLYRRDVWVEIRATDRVRVRGDVYAVTAPSALWENPGSARRGTVVTVRRVG